MIHATNTILKSIIYFKNDQKLQTQQPPYCFPALHPFTKRHHEADEKSATPQLVLNFHKCHRQNLVYVFDLEIAQSMGKTLFQTRNWCMVNFGNMPPECLLRMVTCDGFCNKKHKQRMKTIERCFFDSQDLCKECHQTPPVLMRGRLHAVDSVDVVRRLILRPNPEFTLTRGSQ